MVVGWRGVVGSGVSSRVLVVVSYPWAAAHTQPAIPDTAAARMPTGPIPPSPKRAQLAAARPFSSQLTTNWQPAGHYLPDFLLSSVSVSLMLSPRRFCARSAFSQPRTHNIGAAWVVHTGQRRGRGPWWNGRKECGEAGRR